MTHLNREEEVWEDIFNYEGLYQISNLGRVKSLSRKFWNGVNFWVSKDRIIKQSHDQKGYYKVTICKDKNHKTVRVHRLIAKAFIPNPENKPQVNHINGMKTDNNIKNLEWNTHKENCQHAQDTLLNKSRFSNKQKAAAKKNIKKAQERNRSKKNE